MQRTMQMCRVKVFNLASHCSNPASAELLCTPESLTKTEDGWTSPGWGESNNSPSLTRTAFSQSGMKGFVFGYLARGNIIDVHR